MDNIRSKRTKWIKFLLKVYVRDNKHWRKVAVTFLLLRGSIICKYQISKIIYFILLNWSEISLVVILIVDPTNPCFECILAHFHSHFFFSHYWRFMRNSTTFQHITLVKLWHSMMVAGSVLASHNVAVDVHCILHCMDHVENDDYSPVLEVLTGRRLHIWNFKENK